MENPVVAVGPVGSQQRLVQGSQRRSERDGRSSRRRRQDSRRFSRLPRTTRWCGAYCFGLLDQPRDRQLELPYVMCSMGLSRFLKTSQAGKADRFKPAQDCLRTLN